MSIFGHGYETLEDFLWRELLKGFCLFKKVFLISHNYSQKKKHLEKERKLMENHEISSLLTHTLIDFMTVLIITPLNT